MSELARISDRLDTINRAIGGTVRWLLLAMLLVQFATVLLRYVFGMSYIALQEAVIYGHATVLTLGAGYTLLMDGHVRVDIFYSEASPRFQAWVNLFGSLLFLLPTCAVLMAYTWRFVYRSWGILEGPISVGGIPAVFYLKTLIPLFAVLLLVQGLSLVLRSVVILRTAEVKALA